MADTDVNITAEDLKKKTPDKLDAENERLKAKLYEQEQENKKLTALLEKAKADKKEPGITVINEDGSESKKKLPDTNPWGLSKMVMPPYVKGRVAIYRLIGMDQTNPATGLPVHPVPGMIPGRYTFYDRFERDAMKRDKAVTNITGTERYVEDGKSKVREIIDDIIFDRGYLHVPIEKEFVLYVFMELHPMNKTNRFRPNNAIVAFERIDIKWKSEASQSATMNLALDAATEVRKMKYDEVIAYAASVPEISTSATRPQHEIRDDLMRWAMNNPIAYYKLNKNAKAAIHIHLLDAINFGIVAYKLDKRGYILTETDEVICIHTASQDPMEELIKFLDKPEGKKHYEAILERLNYWDV